MVYVGFRALREKKHALVFGAAKGAKEGAQKF
jgi:hypothetical protein